MQWKAVIFDFNGTLFFDNDKHIIAWNKISLLLRQKPITQEELHTKLNGVPNKTIIEYFTDGNISEEDKLKYSLMKEEFYREACKEDQENFHLVKGVDTSFDYLKENHIPFTIASASIKPNIDFFIENFKLDHWIKPEYIVYDNGHYINKVQMFKDAADKLNVSINDALIVEDSFSGIKHAYEAGCHSILVICEKDKEGQYQNLPGVVKTIQNFEGLKWNEI